MKASTIFGFLSFAALPFTSASPVTTSRRHHNEIAHRARADVDIHKRSFTNARFTFYDVGLGACGTWSAASDHIVALNIEQFGPGYPGEYCFQSITISYQGVSIQAKIVDKCVGCPWGGLDFSRGLFDVFAPESEGVLYGEWWFNNDPSN